MPRILYFENKRKCVTTALTKHILFGLVDPYRFLYPLVCVCVSLSSRPSSSLIPSLFLCLQCLLCAQNFFFFCLVLFFISVQSFFFRVYKQHVFSSLLTDVARDGRARSARNARLTLDAIMEPARSPSSATATRAGAACSAIKVRKSTIF